MAEVCDLGKTSDVVLALLLFDWQSQPRWKHVMARFSTLIVFVTISTMNGAVAGAPPDADLPAATFTELLKKQHAVAIAQFDETPSLRGEDYDGVFQVTSLLKGPSELGHSRVTASVPSQRAKDEIFLVTATRRKSSGNVSWRVVGSVSDRCVQHLRQLTQLEDESGERPKFFVNHLRDADETIALNSHLELAYASDEDFHSAATKMSRAKLMSWLQAKDMPGYAERIYLSMLARCGTKTDAQWLKKQILANPERQQLDAWLGCYLALEGPEGLALVDERYLSNGEARILEVYSAIQSLRFVRGLPESSISTEQLTASFRRVLKNHLMADLVISDLAYAHDWDSVDQVARLYEVEELSFARVPVVNFLRACPGDRAKNELAKLRGRDPKGIKRAESFYPNGFPANPTPTRIRTPRRPGGVFRC